MSFFSPALSRASVGVHNSSLVARLQSALAAHRSRRSLAALETHLLEDIGVSQTDAAQEARKPIWDVPANWRR